MNCQELQNKISQLKDLKRQFEQIYNTLPPGSNREQAKRDVLDKISPYRDEIEAILSELEEAFKYEFVVRNAINPYAEAMRDGGITDTEFTAERKDVHVNLQEILAGDREAYVAAGLILWAQAIPVDIHDFNLSREQIEIIKSRVAQGEIPIFMPGRWQQMNGLVAAMRNLKPKYIEEKQEKEVEVSIHNTAYDYLDLMDEIINLEIFGTGSKEDIKKSIKSFIEEGQDPEMLFASLAAIPENSYVVMVKPNQVPEERTTKKALKDQIKEFEQMKAENPDLNLRVQSLAEYSALQNRFTHRVDDFAKSSGVVLEKLCPLDRYSNPDSHYQSICRFIDLPVKSGGWVPCEVFRYNTEGIEIATHSINDKFASFRVAVRV